MNIGDLLYWAHGRRGARNRFASAIESNCSLCGAAAVILLPPEIRAVQPDDTTHVCHPLAGGCNHGFAATA